MRAINVENYNLFLVPSCGWHNCLGILIGQSIKRYVNFSVRNTFLNPSVLFKGTYSKRVVSDI